MLRGALSSPCYINAPRLQAISVSVAYGSRYQSFVDSRIYSPGTGRPRLIYERSSKSQRLNTTCLCFFSSSHGVELPRKMKSLLALVLLVPASFCATQKSGQAPDEAPKQESPFFPQCEAEKCYSDLEKAAGEAGRLAGFCRDSVASKKSLASEFELAANKTECGDLSQLEVIRPVCDCIAKNEKLEPEGSKAQMKETEAPTPPSPPEFDPGVNASQFLFPDCKEHPLYSFIDISADSPEQLRTFCEKSRGSTLASDVIAGVDEKSLSEHSPDPPATPFDPAQLQPACDCILGAKTESTKTEGTKNDGGNRQVPNEENGPPPRQL
ncbi:hypothetical protein CDD83_10289 [Cordyceps sp. RAO-2017]|nr:hypothetical protein CDD83_10289 [Cordyceps sp. RAO-2017]